MKDLSEEAGTAGDEDEALLVFRFDGKERALKG